MEKYLGFVAVAVFLLSCTNTDRDNQFDKPSEYIVDSPVEGSSSSGVETDNSSSSSGDGEPSSSSYELSSSSAEPSSSSVASSSSSNADDGKRYCRLDQEERSYCYDMDTYGINETICIAERGTVVYNTSGCNEVLYKSSSSSVVPSSSSGPPVVGGPWCVFHEGEICLNGSIYTQMCADLGGVPMSTCPSGYDKYDGYGDNPSSSSSSGSLSSSSSSVSCTANNNTSTHYCSEGTMKAYGSVTDYDGQTYKTVVIGDQTWMAENLNFNVADSKCYDNDSDNCVKYGHLYDWLTAMALPSSCNYESCSIEFNQRGVCPDGWHIPREAEWETLILYVGGSSNAVTRLRANSEWPTNLGTDDYGFSALPGGFALPGDSFEGVNECGFWWSATEYDSDKAFDRYMCSNNSNVMSTDDGNKSNLFSVRCVKN